MPRQPHPDLPHPHASALSPAPAPALGLPPPAGKFFLLQFPQVGALFVPLEPLLRVYFSFPLAGLIVFFAVYIGIINNQSFGRYVRFNAMQVGLVACGGWRVAGAGAGWRTAAVYTLCRAAHSGKVGARYALFLQSRQQLAASPCQR
jgi:hypothetical protein